MYHHETTCCEQSWPVYDLNLWPRCGGEGGYPLWVLLTVFILIYIWLSYIFFAFNFLCKRYKRELKHIILFFSRYSFAIVGINLTSMTYEALRKGSLRTHFYNVTDKAPKIQDFHEVYCKYVGKNHTKIIEIISYHFSTLPPFTFLVHVLATNFHSIPLLTCLSFISCPNPTPPPMSSN